MNVFFRYSAHSFIEFPAGPPRPSGDMELDLHNFGATGFFHFDKDGVDAHHFMGQFPSFSITRHTTNITEPVFPADGAIHDIESTGGLFYFGR